MMRAVVLYGIGDLRFEEVPLPRIKEGEVLIKVKASVWHKFADNIDDIPREGLKFMRKKMKKYGLRQDWRTIIRYDFPEDNEERK